MPRSCGYIFAVVVLPFCNSKPVQSFRSCRLEWTIKSKSDFDRVVKLCIRIRADSQFTLHAKTLRPESLAGLRLKSKNQILIALPICCLFCFGILRICSVL